MTVINIVSSIIYTRDAPLREKIQTFALAGIFLVLLYNSPSGLVFYWVLNQVFSLCKNIVKNMKQPGTIVYGFLCAMLLSVCAYFIFVKDNKFSATKCCFYLLTLFFIVVPFFLKYKKLFDRMNLSSSLLSVKPNFSLFFCSCICFVILIGLCIPGSVIASSPSEFSFLQGDNSPFILLWDSFIKALGGFLFWPILIYNLFGERVKKIMPVLFFCAVAVAALNFFAFSGNYGLISQLLTITDDSKLNVRFLESVLNLFSILVLVCVILFLNRGKHSSLNLILCISLIFSVGIICFVQFNKIQSGYKNAIYARNGGSSVIKDSTETGIEPIMKISRTGKNVFIIMLDRATGAYLQECFSEDKELYEQYDGFVFYPNTIAFNVGTMAGAPPLYGGYEYTPSMINLREEDTVVKKMEEAISMLPRLFAQNGYSALMTDMPWMEGFSEKLSDFYFMDRFNEGIKSLYLTGHYLKFWKAYNEDLPTDYQLKVNKKRFPLYSIMKICPLFIRKKIYHNGDYFAILEEKYNGQSDYGEPYVDTIDQYAELDFLPELTNLIDVGNTFTFMQNTLVHRPNFLQVPEYKPQMNITRFSESKYAIDAHYYVNMAALKLLGKWFEFLKKNNVYDNTRIIISADHGSYEITGLVEGYSSIPRGELTCLLLVKDFNSRGKLKIDNDFMTNADVPSIAVKNLIQNPINPATGKDFTKFVIKNPAYISSTHLFLQEQNREGNFFEFGDDDWYSIQDSIFEKGNWKKTPKDEVYNMTKKYMQNFDLEATK